MPVCPPRPPGAEGAKNGLPCTPLPRLGTWPLQGSSRKGHVLAEGTAGGA